MTESKKNGTNEGDNPDDFENEIFEEGGYYIGDIYVPPPYKPVCSMETNGPRIIISRIEMENFKSYYDIQVIGPLHQNFTSVIGPNGSGKSNIIDAMLFVFGYRASNMRTKKVSNLIHNSSRNQKVTRCSVAVVFQRILDKDDGSYEKLDEEIEVKRTAFSDNTSFYSVNGKRKTYKDIAILLGGYGIDLSSNRFLILQGEVEQISLMKPKALNEHDRGMLEYLEDIIGTTRYKEPISKLGEKLDALNEEHQHRLNRIKLLQRELKDLEGPKNDAVDYIRKQNECIILKNQIFQCQRMEIQAEIDKFTEIKMNKETTLNNIVTSLKELEEEKNQKDKGSNALSISLTDHKKRLSKENARYEKLCNRDKTVQAEMLQINTQRKKLKTELEKEKIKLIELEQVPERNDNLIKDCAKEIAQLEKQHAKLSSDQESARIKFQNKSEILVEKRAQASKKLMPYKETATKLLSKLNMEKSKLNLIQSNENNIKDALEVLEKQMEEISSKLEIKNKDLQNLIKSKPVIQKNLEAAQDELKPIKQKEACLVAKIHGIIKQLSESQQVYQESSSRNKIIDFLMRKKNEGLLPGLLGRLGDLGAIEDKYNVAISTACGSLDNIVCDNMDTAQRALKMLQDNNVGRTTFIALDKQQHFWSTIKANFQSPEDAPRLFDLVRVEDERIRPAFYFALRDTLVGADLEQCMRLAYGQRRFRVVSVKGELFETSGTMSGGGKTVFRNRMGNKVKTSTRRSNAGVESKADVQNLEHQRNSLQRELEEIQNREAALEEIIRTNYQELQKFDSEHMKLSMEVKALKEQHPLVCKNLEQQREKVKNNCSDKKAVAQQEDIIRKLELKHQEAVEDAKELESEVKDIDEKLNTLQKETLSKVEKELKNVTKSIENMKKESAKLTIEVNANKRNVDKCKTVVSKHETDITNFEKALIELKDEQTNLENEVSQLADVIGHLEKKIKELDDEFNSLKSSKGDIAKRLNQLGSSKVDCEQELADAANKLKEAQVMLNHVNSNLSGLKLEEIPVKTKDNQVLKEYSKDELVTFDRENLKFKSTVLKEELKKSQPNMQAIEQYKNKELQFLARMKELDALSGERDNLRQVKENLSKDRLDHFMKGFKIISMKLKELYQVLTLGGGAELDLVDSVLPFAEGVIFNVRPFKKSWKAISDLSGGEKTLASLSLVLALHYYRPSPLYVMDEIDAALDFRNVSIVANYIKERTKNAQFLIISLRNNMFDLSDRFVCIHKVLDCSRAIVMNNDCLIGKAPKNSEVVPYQI